MRNDRKVIILDNIQSDCIEQAMFILKNERPENIDAVAEAEAIIEKYTKKHRHKLYREKRTPTKAAIIGMILGAAVFAGLICAIIF